MKVRKAISSIAYLYIDGFRQMTWGKTLWAVILIKLLIIFAVLKIFFFPDYIATHRGTMKAGDLWAVRCSERLRCLRRAMVCSLP